MPSCNIDSCNYQGLYQLLATYVAISSAGLVVGTHCREENVANMKRLSCFHDSTHSANNAALLCGADQPSNSLRVNSHRKYSLHDGGER